MAASESSSGWNIFRVFRINTATARIASIVLLGFMLAIRWVDPTGVETLRNQSFDWYQRIKPRAQVPVPVRIVDIDEASLQKFGQWPWPRKTMAQLVTNLAQRGAIVVAFDIVFAEPDRLSPPRIAQENPELPATIRTALAGMRDNEEIFAEAIAAARVVLGQTSIRSTKDTPGLRREIPAIPIASKGIDPRPFIFQFPDLVQNMPRLEAAAAGRGVFSLAPDPDGVFRRVPVIVIVRDQYRLALSLEALRVATGGRTALTQANEAGLEGLVVGGKLVTTDRNGQVWPYFNNSHPDRYVSAGSVLEGTVDPRKVAGNIILVGTSAVGLEDIRATPMAAAMPGVEIHAQLLEAVLSDQLLVRPNFALGMELAVLLLIGLGIIYVVPKIGAVWAFFLAAGLQAAFFGVSAYAFAQHRMLIDPTFPIIATALLFVALATANYIREEQQRQQIRGAFGQYISPDLVEQLSQNPERMVLGGETKELTLMFSDVRGFTGISEEYMDDPQGLTRLMNRFLTVLSQPVLDEQGTIDKYMGDAVMAFWNAPIEAEDHALRACRAALGMIKNLNELNAKRAEELQGTDRIKSINVGIGINTGQCVVGNMGSELRFDYTALGDTVNIASRLEGQSKPYGLAIVIGDNTALAVDDKMATIEIDLIRVKGKLTPERMHALIGDGTMLADERFRKLRQANQAMIDAYRSSNWDGADDKLTELGACAESLGVFFDDYLDLYADRISDFRQNPPGTDWDGVYTATSK